jgi:hypothetical protein
VSDSSQCHLFVLSVSFPLIPLLFMPLARPVLFLPHDISLLVTSLRKWTMSRSGLSPVPRIPWPGATRLFHWLVLIETNFIIRVRSRKLAVYIGMKDSESCAAEVSLLLLWDLCKLL